MAPIKGISDRRPRLPRVGVVRLGIKKKTADGKEYPSAVDYFVVNQDDSTPREAYEAFHEVYGDEPREIDVVFASDEIDDFADPFYRMYSQSFGLLCRGTGESAVARWDPQNDGPRPEGVESGTWASSKTKQWVMQSIPCPAGDCPMQQSNPPRCRRTMTLQFLLPNVRGIGSWLIHTGSWNSIANVRDQAIMIKAALGRIRGVPLKLAIEPTEVVPPGGVKKKKVWVLNLKKPDISFNDLVAQVARLPEGSLMLPPAVDEEPPDDVDLIEIEGQVVNSKSGEIVDEHDKRPEQPCKFCDVLLDVEDEWVQMQHGPGKCVKDLAAPELPVMDESVDSSAVEPGFYKTEGAGSNPAPPTKVDESVGSPMAEASGLNPESAGSSPAPPTKEAVVENRVSRGPHKPELEGSTPSTATSAPDAVKSLACGSCGALIDLVRDSQADINSHQAGECRSEPFSGGELDKYKGWQPANVGAVLTQAWRLFKMDRPTAEGITGTLSPQMKPDELSAAWEKVFASKVRS